MAPEICRVNLQWNKEYIPRSIASHCIIIYIYIYSFPTCTRPHEHSSWVKWDSVCSAARRLQPLLSNICFFFQGCQCLPGFVMHCLVFYPSYLFFVLKDTRAWPFSHYDKHISWVYQSKDIWTFSLPLQCAFPRNFLFHTYTNKCK
jgi:hypothetical protein